MSDKYDEIMTQLTSQNVVIKDLKARVEKIEDSRCEDEISQLKDDINDLEWRSRRLNLEFHGIPQTSGENLLEKLNDVATKMGVPDLSEAEVVSAHWLHLKSGQVPVIIARFANQLTRDQWLEKKKELKKNREPIFIQENMTRQNRVLLRAAKDWASAKRYQYVWHKQGKILLREKDANNNSYNPLRGGGPSWGGYGPTAAACLRPGSPPGPAAASSSQPSSSPEYICATALSAPYRLCRRGSLVPARTGKKRGRFYFGRFTAGLRRLRRAAGFPATRPPGLPRRKSRFARDAAQLSLASSPFPSDDQGPYSGHLAKEIGEKSGGRDRPTPDLTLAPANHKRRISRRLSRQLSRLGLQAYAASHA
ncbi:hypothetical protein ISCGN_015615 [Ixodes scapularis]